MLNFLKNRKNHLVLVLVAIFALLAYRLHDLTITNGAVYYQRSLNNRLKKIEIPAKRGEIFDRNGVVLATNEIGYAIELNSSVVPAAQFSDVAIRIYDFLEAQGESHLEFPIFIEGGVFKYRFDDNVARWLSANGYDASWTAEMIFKDMRSANYIDDGLSNYEAFRILYNQGKHLPISTSKMMFLEEVEKQKFLKFYGLDVDTTAEEAFAAIRRRRDFRIDKSYSDADAYKVMVFQHVIKNQGYLKYEPITVAPLVSKKTAVLVQEEGYAFPGLGVVYKPLRVYPEGAVAAHTLGYMGRISSDSEMDYFVKDRGYNRNQLIGKTGIEGTQESVLHGESGYKYIEVDVTGKYVADIDEAAYGLDSKLPKSGENVYLSVDITLQKILEEKLEKAVQCLKEGSVYESPWGDYPFDAYPNVETAAGVVVNVKTGEILAMASYPSYDVNLFANGISQEDWNRLNPINHRNPLAARPLYNTATMMAVQPGSIYKMITGYAALNQGLDPYQKLYSNGYVEVGNQRFGCWYWNDYGGRHGLTDFFKAIEVSCNYYFFNIASGWDYYRNRALNFKMSPMLLTEYSKDFGLDQKTGIEIGEVSMGLPDPDKKKRTIAAFLSNRLKEIAKLYFPEEIVEDEDKLNAVVKEIVSWSDDNPSRSEIIERLLAAGSNPDYVVTERLADIIKYDYFNLMRWYESDTLNLSIGQGDHTYTPVQLARYVATIANGGQLRPLTLLSKKGLSADEVAVASRDKKGVLKYVQKAMLQVTQGNKSSVKDIFKTMPLSIAGKTGTAEKEGLIPPLDEVSYLSEYLKDFAPKLILDDVEAETMEILKRRSEELTQLEKLRDEAKTEAERTEIEQKFNRLILVDYLNKGSAMREAIKVLSNYAVTDEMINAFRLPYDNYSWFVSYAPYEDPEIAVVVSIPQGGQGYYSAPVVRDVYEAYFNLTPPEPEAVDSVKKP